LHPSPAQPLIEVDTAFEEVSFCEILHAGGVIDPVALAGVQDKASARIRSVPVAQADTRPILKVDPPQFPHVVENKAYFIRGAAPAHFRVVGARTVHDRTGRPALLGQRFDPVIGPDGQGVALAVEDGAQVMGSNRSDKYRVPAEGVVAALSHACAARDIFGRLCFAWLTGNGDVHAKNISILATPAGNGASALPTTSRPRCPIAITASRRQCSAAMLASPAGRCSPSQTRPVSRRAAERTVEDVLAATQSIPDELQEARRPFAEQIIRALGEEPAQPAHKRLIDRFAREVAATSPP
jgi:serine/threonine-protein kinase HipA